MSNARAPGALGHLRPLAPTDSLESITSMLHRAYASLGAMGLNYTAVDQAVDVTRRRVARGHCMVVEHGGVVVATVTVNGPFDINVDHWARTTPWFYRDDVAHLHQLAVEPDHQGGGIGRRLVAACEDWARERGFRGMALDTAAPASHLRAHYQALGYRDVDDVHWSGKRYRSVVMVKPLARVTPLGSNGDGAALGANDAAHRIARVRTLWAHVQARDWAAMRALLADGCTMHWPCTRERFLDADAIVRVQAIYPEGWSITVGEVFGTSDVSNHTRDVSNHARDVSNHARDVSNHARVVSSVTVTHGPQTFFARSIFAFDVHGCIAHIDEHWSTAEEPPAWRTAQAIGTYERD